MLCLRGVDFWDLGHSFWCYAARNSQFPLFKLRRDPMRTREHALASSERVRGLNPHSCKFNDMKLHLRHTSVSTCHCSVSCGLIDTVQASCPEMNRLGFSDWFSYILPFADWPLSSTCTVSQVKKAVSAYLHFSNDMRDEVKAANPEAKFGEIGKILGEWSVASRTYYSTLTQHSSSTPLRTMCLTRDR